MLMAIKDRMRLEQCIIGAVVLESNTYPLVADILTAKNFTAWPNADYPKIWQAVADTYPDPIDALTIMHRLQREHGESMVLVLTHATSRVSSASNIDYHAMILVQDCIGWAFLRLLGELAHREPDQAVRDALHEMGAEVQRVGIDPLDVLEVAPDYAASVGADVEVINKLKEIRTGFHEKAERIRTKARFKTAVASMSRHAQHFLDPWPAWRANLLYEICSKVINEEPLHPGFDEALQNLTKFCSWPN